MSSKASQLAPVPSGDPPPEYNSVGLQITNQLLPQNLQHAHLSAGNDGLRPTGPPMLQVPVSQSGLLQPPLSHARPPRTDDSPQRIRLTQSQIGMAYQNELFAKCARGEHESKTNYGVCGIITAVVLFPIGLICLFTDTKQSCSRCGVRLEK